MITWAINGLRWSNDLEEYPKRVVAIRVTAKNAEGLQITYEFQLPNPGEESETFIPFNELTEAWAWEMHNIYNYVEAAEGYLMGETGPLTFGDSLPWSASE